MKSEKHMENFMQETRWIANATANIPTIHLPTEFYYKGKWRKGWVNVVNPHCATAVLGTPGCGKSYAVINNYIKQLIEQGNALYVYDYKFPDLTRIAFNHYRLHPEGYKNVKPQVYIINFGDLPKSHRCNLFNPKFIANIDDAYKNSYTIMMNLNKMSRRMRGRRQTDFSVHSQMVLFASIIWFLRGYKNGKYCTFPHAVELVKQPYKKWFPILMSHPDLNAFITQFAELWRNDLRDHLQERAVSAQTSFASMVSPEIYWVLSGNDFSLDINNPAEPKILCAGGNPKRGDIYATALGLVTECVVLQTYKLGQLMPSSVPSGIIIDELPTIYFGRIRYFIRVAGGSKMAICLGLQDYSQLKRDYGEEECKTMTNGIDVFGAIGNIFSGHALGDTARDLQERFEEVLQQKRQNTRANWRDTMECPISAEKIFNLPQGTFVGNVAEDLKMVDEHGQPVEGMVQNIFHAKIMVDQNEAKAAEKSYQELPIVADFVRDGKDCMEDIIRANFEQIKQDVEQIIKQFS